MFFAIVPMGARFGGASTCPPVHLLLICVCVPPATPCCPLLQRANQAVGSCSRKPDERQRVSASSFAHPVFNSCILTILHSRAPTNLICTQLALP